MVHHSLPNLQVWCISLAFTALADMHSGAPSGWHLTQLNLPVMSGTYHQRLQALYVQFLVPKFRLYYHGPSFTAKLAGLVNLTGLRRAG